MTLDEEKELVRRAKKEPEAFGLLFDANYQKILGYVLRRTADIDLAKDVVSETFLKALKNLWQFKWQGVSFSSWLYRIAANETVNFYRHKKPVVSLSAIGDPIDNNNPLEEITQAQEKLKEHEDFLVAQREISLLPLKYQEVLALRFFEQKQLKEIAEILGKKEGTVKSLLHRSLEKLRLKLNNN
jgi:RNA polymerase sigma-70 factor (ECF subfamily)